MNKQLVLAATLMMGAGCSEQMPAPVISGYSGKPVVEQQPYVPAAVARKAEGAQSPAIAQVGAAPKGAVPEVAVEDIEPAAGAKASVPAKAAVPAVTMVQHKVAPTDTVYSLARQYDTSAKKILEANGMKATSDIKFGQVLNIPSHSNPRTSAWDQVKQALETPQKVSSVSSAETETVAGDQSARKVVSNVSPTLRYSLTRKQMEQADSSSDNSRTLASTKLEDIEPAAGNRPKAARLEESTDADVSVVEHKVEAGETIYRISKLYDASIIDIMAMNDFEKPQDLKAGTLVKIPHAKGVAKSTLPASGNNTVASVVQSGPALSTAPKKDMEGPALKSVRAALGVKNAPSMPAPSTTAEKTATAAPNESENDVSVPAEAAKAENKSENVAGVQDSSASASEAKADADEQVTEKALKKSDVSAKIEKIADTKISDASASEDEVEKVAAVPVKEGASSSEVDALRAEMKRGQVDPVAAKSEGKVWPVRGAILRRFGEQGNGVAHTGINIAVPPGTSVLATDAGTVLYADEGLKTYGKLVLLQHSNGMVSAYAHNGHLLVRKGEKVKKGQVIAVSGASGNVDKPQLHFELRRHASALDPLRELPKL